MRPPRRGSRRGRSRREPTPRSDVTGISVSRSSARKSAIVRMRRVGLARARARAWRRRSPRRTAALDATVASALRARAGSPSAIQSSASIMLRRDAQPARELLARLAAAQQVERPRPGRRGAPAHARGSGRRPGRAGARRLRPSASRARSPARSASSSSFDQRCTVASVTYAIAMWGTSVQPRRWPAGSPCAHGCGRRRAGPGGRRRRRGSSRR